MGECDLADNCTGSSAACPADAKKPNGTSCTDDGNVCTNDQCDGTLDTCQHPNNTAPCDDGNACTTSDTCSGGTCVGGAAPDCDDSNPCTVDTCNPGTGCVHTPGNAGALCRAAAGICDTAETCDGTNAACPADQFLPNTTECRATTGECDPAEMCTGSAAACPADAFTPSGTACTADSNVCTLDQCDGAGACTHPAGNAGTECRASADVCDVAETCTGTDTACPVDGFAANTVVCRASAGDCDLADTCTGSSAACPADAKSTAQCRASAGVCDIAESLRRRQRRLPDRRL